MRLRVISEFEHGQKPQKWFTDFTADPDYFFMEPDAVPFIYNADGTLHIGEYNETHRELIAQNDDGYYQPTYGAEMGSPLSIDTLRKDLLPNRALLGRISGKYGNDQRYVTFWNAYKPVGRKLLPECLKALLQADLISLDNDIVVSGDKHMYVMDYLRGGRFYDSPEENERKQKMQELHLMQPDAKKAAMKDLGLDAASRKQPWQKAAEQNKLVRPGQKWWAMQSESLK